MNRLLLVMLTFLFLARLSGWANPPDYLTNDYEPADRAMELASPFTEFVTEQHVGWLGAFYSEPFLRYAGFSLQPRLYYRSLETNSGVQQAFAAGGSLSFITGWWRETLQLGATAYTTQPVFAPSGAGNTGLVRPNGDGLSVLGQAWAKLRIGSAIATLFRQALELPFINGNDSRMIPNTFEAYQLEAEPWKEFRLNFGYVAGMKSRTSADFEPMSKIAGAPQVNRGTSFADLLIGSEERTYLGAFSDLTWDLFSCTYVQAGHTWQFPQDFEIRCDVQFTDQRSVGSALLGTFNTQLYGARLTASYADALLSLSLPTQPMGRASAVPSAGSHLQLPNDFRLRSSEREGLWRRSDLRLFRARTHRRQSICRLRVWLHDRWPLGKRDQCDRGLPHLHWRAQKFLGAPPLCPQRCQCQGVDPRFSCDLELCVQFLGRQSHPFDVGLAQYTVRFLYRLADGA